MFCACVFEGSPSVEVVLQMLPMRASNALHELLSGRLHAMGS
jgi:hypothetical protein